MKRCIFQRNTLFIQLNTRVMESLNNENSYGNSNSSGSNVELTLLGIDKKWVRSNGTWRDKSKLAAEMKENHSIIDSMEPDQSTSPWWQFWKA